MCGAENAACGPSHLRFPPLDFDSQPLFTDKGKVIATDQNEQGTADGLKHRYPKQVIDEDRRGVAGYIGDVETYDPPEAGDSNVKTGKSATAPETKAVVGAPNKAATPEPEKK